MPKKQPLYPHVPKGSKGGNVEKVTIAYLLQLADGIEPSGSGRIHEQINEMGGYYESALRHFRRGDYAMAAEMFIKVGRYTNVIDAMLSLSVRHGWGNIPESKRNDAERLTDSISRFIEETVGKDIQQ